MLSANFASSVDSFKSFFTSYKNAISVSKSLDPDQARRKVGPDLGPNYLRRLSGDDKTRHQQVESLPWSC